LPPEHGLWGCGGEGGFSMTAKSLMLAKVKRQIES